MYLLRNAFLIFFYHIHPIIVLPIHAICYYLPTRLSHFAQRRTKLRVLGNRRLIGILDQTTVLLTTIIWKYGLYDYTTIMSIRLQLTATCSWEHDLAGGTTTTHVFMYVYCTVHTRMQQQRSNVSTSLWRISIGFSHRNPQLRRWAGSRCKGTSHSPWLNIGKSPASTTFFITIHQLCWRGTAKLMAITLTQGYRTYHASSWVENRFQKLQCNKIKTSDIKKFILNKTYFD